MGRKGYHETSIADVASRSHASRATVYQYFGDERDILAAIGQRVEQASSVQSMRGSHSRPAWSATRWSGSMGWPNGFAP